MVGNIDGSPTIPPPHTDLTPPDTFKFTFGNIHN